MIPSFSRTPNPFRTCTLLFSLVLLGWSGGLLHEFARHYGSFRDMVIPYSKDGRRSEGPPPESHAVHSGLERPAERTVPPLFTVPSISLSSWLPYCGVNSPSPDHAPLSSSVETWKSELYSAKLELIANFLHTKQEENLWCGSESYEGVILKQSKGRFISCPRELMTRRTPFYEMVAQFNVRVSEVNYSSMLYCSQGPGGNDYQYPSDQAAAETQSAPLPANPCEPPIASHS